MRILLMAISIIFFNVFNARGELPPFHVMRAELVPKGEEKPYQMTDPQQCALIIETNLPHLNHHCDRVKVKHEAEPYESVLLLPPGESVVIFTSYEYYPAKVTVNFESGSYRQVWVEKVPDELAGDFVLDEKLYGSLETSSIPEGAKVFVNQMDTGLRTPAFIQRIPAGGYMLLHSLEGYNSNSRPIEIMPGEPYKVTLLLHKPGTSTDPGRSIPNGKPDDNP